MKLQHIRLEVTSHNRFTWVNLPTAHSSQIYWNNFNEIKDTFKGLQKQYLRNNCISTRPLFPEVQDTRLAEPHTIVQPFVSSN